MTYNALLPIHFLAVASLAAASTHHRHLKQFGEPFSKRALGHDNGHSVACSGYWQGDLL